MPDRLILDVTKTFQTEFSTGIQRVVRELLRRRTAIGARLGLAVVVVVAAPEGYYRLDDAVTERLINPLAERSASVVVQSRAAQRLKQLLRLSLPLYAAVQRRAVRREMARRTRQMERISIGAGDVVVLADYIGAGSTSVAALADASPRAAATIAVVYDIIALLHPDMVPGTTIHPFRWAFQRTVPVVDGLVTIARSTADEIRNQPLVRRHVVPVASFHLGHDLRSGGTPAAPTIPDAAWSGGPTRSAT